MNILPSRLLPADRRVAPTFGVRAERVQLGRDGPVFTATVNGVEQLGASAVIHLEREGLELFARSDDRETPGPGDVVGVSFGDRDLRFFESDDGRAVHS